MAINLLNAFSFNMISDSEGSVLFEEMEEEKTKDLIYHKGGIVSYVGHRETANVFSSTLGVNVEFRRENVSLKKGEGVILGQYKGPRLPEGATELPEGSKIVWYYIRLE